MGKIDLEVFKAYLIDGAEVESCYTEYRDGETYVGPCIDISHKGFANYTETDLLIGSQVLTLILVVVYCIMAAWYTRKTYK